jgi:hypothetical protein
MFQDLCQSHVVQPRSTRAGQLTMLASVALAMALLAVLAGAPPQEAHGATPAAAPGALWGGDGFARAPFTTQGPHHAVDNQEETGHEAASRSRYRGLAGRWTWTAVPKGRAGHGPQAF